MGGILVPDDPGIHYWYPNEAYRLQVGYAMIVVNPINNKILSIHVELSIPAL